MRNSSAFRRASCELNTYVIPPHLDYQDAALAEPLACVVKGVEDAEHATRAIP